MGSRLSSHFTLVTAALGACAGALLAGNLSNAFAQLAVQLGGPSFLREPINAALALALLWAWQKWRPGALYSPPKWSQFIYAMPIGLCLGIALPGLALGVLFFAGAVTIKPPSGGALTLVVPLVFLLIHGLAEESLVRGIAQREGHNYFGPLGGIALAAICFCALQTLQGYGGVWQVTNSLLFGAVLGFLALGKGGIWAAIGAHAGWTWLELGVLGGEGQIAKTTNWLAGSGHDSYGSPAFTLVLIVVVGAQILLHLRKQESKL
jgi:membrane protease YdiL (CAAX protease family)